ncbi:LacI family DNA-binding transcriptional regulator [Parerythrobacter jejuensis]|uniref:LacI family DNA-binding transcriptional regulator n=1 Tax=Parerythrobacter jejuensis TaxID=795812 RepID=A0A845ARU9_9SPHN|nr:LacI family DNA-binding transcriptional regulator [Parerythrobacter jejuensis]MXP31913.1 LacI family DNA-binding transcriptional regulator [Parerythrobacter jejuensis]
MSKDERRLTSFDVAARAGVSQSTVSRALSGSPTITEATRTRVIAAARDLGYVVDERAARLRSGKSKTIAVVVIGRAGQGAASVNPFYYSLLGSVCTAAAQQGYQALVSIQSEPEQFFGQFIERGQADAVVVLGTATNRQAWDHFSDYRRVQSNLAFWGAPFDGPGYVRSDNHAGAKLAVERLIAGGYKRIAFVGETDGAQRQFSERYEGYRTTLEAAGLTASEAITAPGETREEQGAGAVAALLESGDGFDAVFSACDAMALGILARLRDAGQSVPEDFGVVGFDGLGVGAHSSPPLTTIEPDFAEAGLNLVEAALGGADDDRDRRVSVHLVERASAR